MDAVFGQNLKELIYSPMGFSIKDGQRVAPYALSDHFDHVRAAWGMGQGNPAFFETNREAQAWEKRVAPSHTAVRSITSNSSEFGDTNEIVINGGVNVTVSGEHKNPTEIADAVAQQFLASIKKATYTELNAT